MAAGCAGRLRPCAPGPRLICFHAQQAAEKAIKAVLLSRGQAIPFTHNLQTLADLLLACMVPLEAEVREAVALTPYAVTTRYPGFRPPLGQEHVDEAVRLAAAVLAWADALVGGGEGTR